MEGVLSTGPTPSSLNIYRLGKHVGQPPDLWLEDGLGILENIGRLDHRASS